MRELLQSRWSYRKNSLSATDYEALLERRCYYEEYQESVIAQLFAALPALSGRVLDFGCGEGGLVVALRQRGIAAYGIDVATNKRALETVEIAKLRALRYGLPDNIFESYDGKTLPYRAETFNYVISQHVFEHVDAYISDNHFQYLQEARRVLKQGGGFLLTCPNKLYPIETHTQILFFQWLPAWTRPLILRYLKPKQFHYLNSVDGLDYPAYLTPGQVLRAVQTVFPYADFATGELFRLKLEGQLGDRGNTLLPTVTQLLGQTFGKRFYHAFGRQISIVAFKETDDGQN